MYRSIEKKLKNFYNGHPNKAVMLIGPRQVGKTYSLKKFAKKYYKSFITIDFIEDESNIDLIKGANSADEIMLRISAKFGASLIPNESIIIFDEIQVVPNLVTFIKYLVKDYPYDFVLTGSLLGTSIKDATSVPVGYVDIWKMWPMTFKEFAVESGSDMATFKHLSERLQAKKPIDHYIHEYYLDIFKKYLIVGGMPEVVKTYLETHNLANVREIQESIIKTYKIYISKYNKKNKFYLNEIYDAVPSEINSENKRFMFNKIDDNARFSKYEEAFFWLKNAGVVLPTYKCTEAKVPLKRTKKKSIFKLYMSDVGLLTCAYGQNAQTQILQGNDDINCGSIYENAMAQMLMTANEELYYYNNKQKGEVDFLTESSEGITAIEVKSGKDYYRHSALDNLLKTGSCKYATVACKSNVEEKDDILYLPIYAFGFLGEDTGSDYIF